MSFEEEFDRIIRQKAEELDYPFEEKNWERASRMLDDQERYTVAAPARVYLPAALVLAAGTAAFFTLAYLGKPEAGLRAEVTALHQAAPLETSVSRPESAASPAPDQLQKNNTGNSNVSQQQPAVPEMSSAPEEPEHSPAQRRTPTPVAAAGTQLRDHQDERTNEADPVIAPVAYDEERNNADLPVPGDDANKTVSPVEEAEAHYLLFAVNGQLPSSGERDLVLPAVSLPAAYDDYFRKHRKHHWASAEAGTAYGLGWNGMSGIDARGFNWYAGLGYGLYLGNRAGISTGAQLGNLSNIDQPFYAAAGKDYGFGSTNASTLITTTELCYAAVPLRFHYFPATGHEFAAGINAARVIHASNRIDTFAVQNDLPVQGSTLNTGLYEGISPFNIQLSFSYRLSVCRRMAIRAEYLHGLTDLYLTDYSAGKKEQSRMLRLGIQYLIFDK